jgi:hypothetical protein
VAKYECKSSSRTNEKVRHFEILVFQQNRKNRRKMRLIEINAKCRYLKKLTSKRTLRQVFYLSEAQIPYPAPLHVFVYTVYLFTQVRGGGRANQREV